MMCLKGPPHLCKLSLFGYISFPILYPLISRRMINTIEDLPKATPLAHDICLGRATRLDGNYYAHYISFREKDTVLALMK